MSRFNQVISRLKLGLLLMLFTGWVNPVISSDTLFIGDYFIQADLTPYIRVYDSPEMNDFNDAYRVDPDKYKKVSTSSFGFSTHYFWLKVSFKNTTDQELKEVLVINNPHIDLLKVWETSTSTAAQLIFQGGDAIKFHERTLVNRNFIVPINLRPNQSRSFLILADKRNASVSVPMELISEKTWQQGERNSLFLYGVYFGVLTLIILFALFVYYLFRQAIYFWYAFYLFFLALYLLAHIGLLFQFAYPNLNWINDYSRPFFITLSTSALIHFIRLLLNVKQWLPRLDKMYTLLIVILNISALWWLATPWWHQQQTIIYLNLQNTTLLTALILVLVTSIITFKHQRVVVYFFWIAFMSVLSAGLSIILIESGIVNETAIFVNPLFLGSLIEAVVFALGLAYWSKIKEQERVQLSSELHNNKKQMLHSYINGMESEKSKVSSELHDDIGSRLSHLKRVTEDELGSKHPIIETFKTCNKKVRSISHELSRPSFAANEFLISIKHLTLSHQTEKCTIHLQVFDFPDEMDLQFTSQLYRMVQSSLSHIERYGVATLIEIQFFFYNNQIVLAIEDNGLGVNYTGTFLKRELKDIKSRVALLNGEIDISSSHAQGTSLMITIPISND